MIEKPGILIVDDRDSWRLLCGEALKIAGYACGFAEDAQQAIEELKTGHYGIISLNFNLKRTGQLKGLLGRLHMEFPGIPIVITTGSFSGSLIEINEKAKFLMTRYPNIRKVLFKANLEESQDEFVDALLEAVMELALGSDETLLENSGDTLVTWLHLSDFHFKGGEQWDARIVFRHLIEDIQKRTACDPALETIDFVFITGDLSFSGRPDQYQEARRFLRELKSTIGTRKDHFFIVPGNHDVNWNNIGSLAKRALLKNREAVNTIYLDINARRTYLERFKDYRTFINSEYRSMKLENDDVFYVTHRRVEDQVIRIIGLNSAWASEETEDGEFGKLILGDVQVRKALASSRRTKADLTIVLLHHPLEWLAEFDRRDCEPLCYGGCDLLLHGHLHETGLSTLKQPGRRATLVGAGACYLSRDWPNSYNLGCLNLRKRQGTVYFREYTAKDGGHWTKDVRTYKAAPDGKYDFQF